MRVLASSDVHGRRVVYEWLLTVARNHDVESIVLAGDLLGCPDGFDTPEDAQRHEAESVIRFWAMSTGTVTQDLGVPGNISTSRRQVRRER
jgi:Icc-related predicted phosphoesterase